METFLKKEFPKLQENSRAIQKIIEDCDVDKLNKQLKDTYLDTL